MQDGGSAHIRTLLPGYGTQCTNYGPRRALLRLKDGRLLSGCGGDLEVLHPLEMERSQNTGMPVKVTVMGLFGGKDTIKGIIQLQNSDHVFVFGSRNAALIHGAELFEGTVVASERILQLNANIIAVDVERHDKTELLLTFLLETGIFHYSLSLDDNFHYQCLLCFKCNRPILSGILWRDGGALHIAYYDGYIRVGIINEDYEDMLLVKRISSSRNSLFALMDSLQNEVTRLANFEENEKGKRTEMLERIRTLQAKLPSMSSSQNSQTDEECNAAHSEFIDLKMSFRNHSIRADRISHRLLSLRKLLSLVLKAIEASNELDRTILALETEMDELTKVSKLHEECVESGNRNLIGKSRGVLEEKKYVVEELMRKVRTVELNAIVRDWDSKLSVIIESLSGASDPPKDMRNILCHNIFEHRPERTDRFTHFLLDQNVRDITLYCMSGLSTLAIYPRKAVRVASISLDKSYETSLTSACLMTSLEGVYVADEKGVFPIYFYRQRGKTPPSQREKRYFDAGAPVSLPVFDSITSILMEPTGLILGSVTGGLLHLAFDNSRKYEHLTIASSVMAHPFSQGPIQDLKMLAAGESHLAIHASPLEVAISEKDHDRWHRITHHMGGANCLAVTSFSLDHRGAFVIAGSQTYARIKALQYTEDNMVGLHDLAESRVTEDGKPVEVLNVSLDPSMEFRPFPCKLRYAVGYADKAIRTYVALLTGEHDFNISEKFIAQIEPLHNINQLICFHGRPMGCYASNSKTLQVWNDLDRHQQKKMKSERMELHRMDQGITCLDRVEGRSAYLLIAFKDGRIDIFEERGRGTGKIDKTGTIETGTTFNVLRTRATSTSCGDRLFIHGMANCQLLIYTALMEGGRLVQSCQVLASPLTLHSANSLELLPFKPYEFVLFGNGIHVHSLSTEERKVLDKFRDFEF